MPEIYSNVHDIICIRKLISSVRKKVSIQEWPIKIGLMENLLKTFLATMLDLHRTTCIMRTNMEWMIRRHQCLRWHFQHINNLNTLPESLMAHAEKPWDPPTPCTRFFFVPNFSPTDPPVSLISHATRLPSVDARFSQVGSYRWERSWRWWGELESSGDGGGAIIGGC